MADKPYGCGTGPALDVAGGKWKVVILCEMEAQPRRFGELRRRIEGISEKVLTMQLRELEEAGLVERHVRQVVPAHVEYALTDWGRSLHAAFVPLAEWGARYEAAMATPAGRRRASHAAP